MESTCSCITTFRTTKVTLAQNMACQKQFDGMSDVDIKTGVNKLKASRIKQPARFHKMLLSREVAQAIQDVLGAGSSKAILKIVSIFKLPGLVIVEFNSLGPLLRAMDSMTSMEMLSWLHEKYIDLLLVPLISEGDAKVSVVHTLAGKMCAMFEEVTEHVEDDAAAKLLLSLLQVSRCVVAVSSSSLEEVASHIEEIDSVWACVGTVDKTPQSTIAFALSSNEYWHSRTTDLHSQASVIVEHSEMLTQFGAAIILEEPDLKAKLKKVNDECAKLVEIKAMSFPGAVVEDLYKKVFDNVGRCWETMKVRVDASEASALALLSDCQKTLSYAELAFPHEDKLQDYISECSAIVLSLDGQMRAAGFLAVCATIITGADEEPRSLEAMNIISEDIIKHSKDSLGLAFNDADRIVINKAAGCLLVALSHYCQQGPFPNMLVDAMERFHECALKTDSQFIALIGVFRASSVLELAESKAAAIIESKELQSEEKGKDFPKLRKLQRSLYAYNGADDLDKDYEFTEPSKWEEVRKQGTTTFESIAKAVTDTEKEIVEKQVAEAVPIARGGEHGHSWAQGFKWKTWDLFCARYTDTLAKADHKALETYVVSIKKASLDYQSLGSSLEVSVNADSVEQADQVVVQLTVTIATQKLMQVFLSSEKKDKIELRKKVSDIMKGFKKGEENEIDVKLLQPLLLVKVDAALKMKNV